MDAKTATAANGIVDGMRPVIDTGAGSPTLRVYSGATLCLQIALNATSAFTAAGNARDESTGAATPGRAWAAAPVDGGGHWDSFSKLPESGSNGLVGDRASIYDAAGTRQYDLTLGTVAAGTAEFRLTTLTFDEAVAVTTTTCPYIQCPIV